MVKKSSFRMLINFFRLLRRCFTLAAPYSRRKLAAVLTVIFLGGLFQVIGVTSVFPFFAIAAQPDIVRHSRLGGWLLAHLPPMDQNTLLIWVGCASIGLLFLANTVALAGEVIRSRYSHGLGHFLRTRMMKALSTRPYGYFLERNSAVLLQKVVVDVMLFINSVFLQLMDALSSMVTLIFLILTFFCLQPVIALGAGVLLGGFYGFVFMFLHRRSRRLSEGIKQAGRGTMLSAQQFLGGIKPILVHEKISYFTDEFCRHSAAQARLFPRVLIFSNGPRYLIEPIAYGGLVAAVVWLALQGRKFTDILPHLTVMALASYRMLPSIQTAYSKLNQINTMSYTVKEIEAELKQSAIARAPDAHCQPMAAGPSASLKDMKTGAPLEFEKAIYLENITFRYPVSKQPVLENLSLEIPKNHSLGVIGSTGSGKSTLADIILGLHRAQSGFLRVDDRVLTPEDLPAWHALIGYVPQDIYLLDASVTANIAFGVPKTEINWEHLRSAAEAAQILEFIEEELPSKWDTVVGERGVRLSGGQRQRIGLARALFHQPQILILDEATSALDTDTEAGVMQAINALHGQLTMIIIAHRLTTIEHCNSVIRLEKGIGLQADSMRSRIASPVAASEPF